MVDIIESMKTKLSLFKSYVGFIGWFFAIALFHIDLAESILLLAPLVLIQIGMDIVANCDSTTDSPRLLNFATSIQFPSAIILILSFSQQIGPLAGALAVPWFLVTLLHAIRGLARIVQPKFRSADQFCRSAGLVYLLIGGTGIFLYRLGYQVLDFPPGIILLTGVHFHFAGFILPLIASLLIRETRSSFVRSLSIAIVISIPIVGVGITFSPIIEVIAALLLATGCIILAMIQFREAMKIIHNMSRSLLIISSVSLMTAMLFASVYAVGEFLQTRWLTIPEMIPTHGALNAFGFALCGLLGWKRYLSSQQFVPQKTTSPKI